MMTDPQTDQTPEREQELVPVAPEADALAVPAAPVTTIVPVPPSPAAAQTPSPYAIVATGGKQYRVKVGDRIAVERLGAETGSEVTLDQVLLIGGAGTTRVGTPLVPGAAVSARVDDHFRGDKIVVFKYKPKKRYRRRTGHRQALTHLTITNINTAG